MKIINEPYRKQVFLRVLLWLSLSLYLSNAEALQAEGQEPQKSSPAEEQDQSKETRKDASSGEFVGN
jgi:hypothetical protein